MKSPLQGWALGLRKFLRVQERPRSTPSQRHQSEEEKSRFHCIHFPKSNSPVSRFLVCSDKEINFRTEVEDEMLHLTRDMKTLAMSYKDHLEKDNEVRNSRFLQTRKQKHPSLRRS